MPTQKPIIPVAMDEDLVRRIDDYRRSVEGSIPSRSEAIRQLIEQGLRHHESGSGEGSGSGKAGPGKEDSTTLFPESPKSKPKK